jgi:uncharacterized protein
MKMLPEFIGFDWDDGNIEKNLRKHNVTTHEAEEMLAIEPFIARHDSRHSIAGEIRLQALGKSKDGRKLFIAFTIRNNRVRVISVRDMTINEERAYERLQKNS